MAEQREVDRSGPVASGPRSATPRLRLVELGRGGGGARGGRGQRGGLRGGLRQGEFPFRGGLRGDPGEVEFRGAAEGVAGSREAVAREDRGERRVQVERSGDEQGGEAETGEWAE